MRADSITRRQALLSLPALGAASSLLAQSSKQPTRVRSLSHMTLTVSDRKRSVQFYQGLFGLPVQHRQGNSIGLRIGPGPQYISLSQGGPNAKPGVAHFCMTVENFSVEGITKALGDHGVTKGDSGAMKTWVRMRGPEANGAAEGTPELYFGDPNGINIQLQDVSYCGGGGALGNACKPPEPAPSRGLINVRDLSHFTLDVSDGPRSTTFYREVFGMPILNRQGPNGIGLAVGSRRQFVFLNSTGRPPRINHGCFTIEGFRPDAVLKKLAEFGLKPRGGADSPLGPLMYYVTLRMEDRGGSRDGTPELYFTDPDGILMQIQDVSYCGGAGALGNVCD
jgi:catechol 2,3-dioxygenase-like lactoylglutathione lyase family enzyme